MTNSRFIILTSLLLFFSGCKKDEPLYPVIPNEEELITTFKYTLTPIGGGENIILTFKDLDGDGGNPPTISKGKLDTNTTYSGSVELLNELENPVGNITEEVREESNDHQLFYQSTISELEVSYNDNDLNNNPIGLVTQVKTKAAGSGNITITLRHKPNKSGNGVQSGDITNAGGETDIVVTFELDVQ